MGIGNEMHKTPQMAQAGFKSNKNRTLVIFSHNSNKIVSKFFRMNFDTVRELSQITFALKVGRWSEKRVVYYIKSAN